MGIFEKLQTIDRRLIYLLLALVITAPLIWRIELPVPISPAVQGAYQTVEKMPSDKIALLSIMWAAGTIAENEPQTEALIRHLFKENKKFAIVAFDIQGSQFAYRSAQRIAREMHKEYGTDWVHWGFRPVANMVLILQGMARNVPKAIGTDIKGTPLRDIPMMRNIKTIDDIGLIADITPSASLEIWIAYIYGPYRTPIIYAPTAVMGPEGFNPLDAGQIKGMLFGMKGAAEYERLLGRRDFATRAASALSTSHLLIMILMVLGNIGYVVSRRRAKAQHR